jgi:hypothetical protein
VKRLINVVCIAFLLFWLAPKLLLVRINPWEIGVRRSLTGGITEQDFHFGYQFSLPLLHSWYRMPRTLQYLNYNDEPGAEARSLEVRTSANNVIYVDVTIPWHIKDGEAWRIIQEGFIGTYPQKVASTTTGILRETLAAMTNTDIYQTDKRQEISKTILPKLNAALEQYHVEANSVVIRAIRFRPEYEQKLQDKQYFIVQGKLDEALRKESVAIQSTETLEKTIEKEINVKREEWNEKIEELKTKYELEIAAIEAEAVQYDRRRRSEGDAFYAEAEAAGNLAEAKAEALGERLKARALASQAGKTYSAITAAENFELGDIQLNSNDPNFLQTFGSMAAWRKFFMGR